MEIKLNDLNFQEVFTAAIMQSLDNDKKEELIKGALQYLMTKGSGYNDKKTPLQEAFEIALRSETINVAKEYLSNNAEIKEVLNGIIRDAVTKIATDNREKTVEKVADKIIEGLYSEKY